MADRALALINSFACCLIAGVLRQFNRPGHLVGIDVQDAGLWIIGRPSPLRAAIKAGENDSVFIRTQGNELAVAAKRPKLLERPLVRLWSAIGQHVLRQTLPSIRLGLGRE